MKRAIKRLILTALAGIAAVSLFGQPLQGKAASKGTSAAAKDSEIADLRLQISRLSSDLAACRGAATPLVDHLREEAIASVRAVRSALNGGANLETFRKYEVESRIKVDVLPETPENKPIREISDLYADALSFAIVRFTGSVTSSELQRARTKYIADSNITKGLSTMYAGEFHSGREYEYNEASAKFVERILLINADELMQKLH